MARRISIAQRDAELEHHLVTNLEVLEQGGFADGPVQPPLVRYGGRFRLTAEDREEDDPLLPFLASDDPVDPADEVELPDVVPDELDHEYAYETLEPAPDWPARHQARFWRLKAACYRDRYSDAVLNLVADALARAIPWHLEHDPPAALRMLAHRALTMSWASYGDRVLPDLDRAVALWPTLQLAPAEEYDFVLRACEVVDRCRAWQFRDFHRAAELLALGLRGLELAERLDPAPQRSRLYHAVADALTDGTPAELPREVLGGRLGHGGPAEWAQAAWTRAIALEVGDFFGKTDPQRVAARVRQYERGLALLRLRAGAVDEALAVLAPPEEADDEDRVRGVMARLGAERVDPVVRARFLADRVRRGVVAGAADDAHERRRALEYLQFAVYALEDLGQVEEAGAVAAEADRVDWLRDAAEERRNPRRPSPAMEKLGDVLVAALRRRPQPEETPERRIARIAHERCSAAFAATELLFRATPTVTGDQLRVEVEIACPPRHLPVILADPAIAPIPPRLEQDLRETLPGVAVELRTEAVSLELWGMPSALRSALSAAGATEALARLGLAPVEVDLEAERQRQVGIRIEVRVWRGSGW